MGTTSEKLTYLNTTKNLIKEELNLGGANITNEPFRIYKDKLEGIYKDFLANGTDTLWNNWEKVTGTGETITLNNTIEAKMNIVYKGNTSQESTTGKNLCYFSNFTEGGVNFNGSEINVGNTTSSVVYVGSNFNLQDDTSKSGKTYTIYACVNGTKQTGSSGTGLSINFAKTGVPVAFQVVLASSEGSFNNRIYVGTITLGENEVFRNVSVVTNNAITANINVKVMVVEGSYTEQTIGDYEPYTNGASPNPDYPQDIQVVSGDNNINVVGKNLFTLKKINNNTVFGIERTINNSELKLNGTSSGAGQVIGRQTTGIILPGGTYSVLVQKKSGNVTPNGKYTVFYFRKPDGTEITALNINNYSGNYSFKTTFVLSEETELYVEIYCTEAGYTLDNLELQFQIEKGTTALTYEEYKGQSYPISLDYTNLFKKQDISSDDLNKRLNQIGENYNENGYFISPFIKVDKDTQYTINYTPTAYTRICYYASNNTNSFISKNDDTSSFTTPSTCQYLRFCNLMADIDNIRLKKGSTITNNYIELCKIGNYQDYFYKDSGSWYLHKEIGKVVLNGSESNWNVAKPSNLYRVEKVFNILPYTDTSRHIGRFICSHFYPNTNDGIGIIFQYQSTLLFYVPSGITTVEQWKTWLGNNNTTLYYVLETPPTTEITDTTLISQLEAIKKSYNTQTNISQTNTDKPFILDVVALGELEI